MADARLTGLPDRFDGAAAWVGPEMAAREDEWIVRWSESQVEELEAAAHHYLSLGRDVGEITAEDFPLPTLAPRLEEVKERLLRGIGFEVRRGLPVERYDQLLAATIFCGSQVAGVSAVAPVTASDANQACARVSGAPSSGAASSPRLARASNAAPSPTGRSPTSATRPATCSTSAPTTDR